MTIVSAVPIHFDRAHAKTRAKRRISALSLMRLYYSIFTKLCLILSLHYLSLEVSLNVPKWLFSFCNVFIIFLYFLAFNARPLLRFYLFLILLWFLLFRCCRYRTDLLISNHCIVPVIHCLFFRSCQQI